MEFVMIRLILYVFGGWMLISCIIGISVKLFGNDETLARFYFSNRDINSGLNLLYISLGLLAAGRIISLLENIEARIEEASKKE